MHRTFVIAVFLAATTAMSAHANGPNGISDFCAGVIEGFEVETNVNGNPDARGLYNRQLRAELDGNENKCRRFLINASDDVSPHRRQNPGNDKPVGNAPFDGERGEVPSGRGS